MGAIFCFFPAILMSVAKCKDKTHDEQSGTAADETVPEVLEARERERVIRLHQMFVLVDQCTHI